jgi:hypothetical protein
VGLEGGGEEPEREPRRSPPALGAVAVSHMLRLFFVLALVAAAVGLDSSVKHEPRRLRKGLRNAMQDNCSAVPMEDVMAKEYARNQRPGHVPPRVLVTGAAGFIGSHVAEACAERLGFTVVAMDDLSGGFLRNLEWLTPPSLFVRGDVQNDTTVASVFAEHGPFDYVYHLAAYAAEGSACARGSHSCGRKTGKRGCGGCVGAGEPAGIGKRMHTPLHAHSS